MFECAHDGLIMCQFCVKLLHVDLLCVDFVMHGAILCVCVYRAILLRSMRTLRINYMQCAVMRIMRDNRLILTVGLINK